MWLWALVAVVVVVYIAVRLWYVKNVGGWESDSDSEK